MVRANEAAAAGNLEAASSGRARDRLQTTLPPESIQIIIFDSSDGFVVRPYRDKFGLCRQPLYQVEFISERARMGFLATTPHQGDLRFPPPKVFKDIRS